MSFKNSGTTVSGRKFFRGEAILVERMNHLVCGFISEIGESDGEDFVTANLQTGVFNTMGGGSGNTKGPGVTQFPVVEYEGTGYRHQSTRQVRGEAGTSKGMLLFCFANEEPTFATGDAPGTPAPPVEVVQPVDETQGDNAPHGAVPPVAPFRTREQQKRDRKKDK